MFVFISIHPWWESLVIIFIMSIYSKAILFSLVQIIWFNFVWKSKVPYKVKTFAWVGAQNKVNTNYMLVRPPFCPLSICDIRCLPVLLSWLVVIPWWPIDTYIASCTKPTLGTLHWATHLDPHYDPWQPWVRSKVFLFSFFKIGHLGTPKTPRHTDNPTLGSLACKGINKIYT